MTTLPNLGLNLPTRGAPGSGHWADVLDDNLRRTDAHDHQPGKGLRIRSLALNIDGDVSFSSSWAVTALNRASFSSVAPPTANRSLFVADGSGGLTANELYWRSNAGAQVKVTNGSALNFAAFVGGIGGDYQAVGAQLNYDDAVKRYTLKEGTLESNGWAKLQAGTLRLSEFGTVETVFVEQACPAGLAVSYTMTWPTALPGAAGTLVQIDNTGQIAFGNTSFAMNANQNITLQGTGDLKHGDRVLTMVASATGSLQTGTAITISNDGSVNYNGASTVIYGIPLRTGDRIKSVTFAATGNNTVDGDAQVFTVPSGVGAQTNIGTTTLTNVSSTKHDEIVDVVDTVLGAGDAVHLLIETTASGLSIGNIRITYDHP